MPRALVWVPGRPLVTVTSRSDWPGWPPKYTFLLFCLSCFYNLCTSTLIVASAYYCIYPNCDMISAFDRHSTCPIWILLKFECALPLSTFRVVVVGLVSHSHTPMRNLLVAALEGHYD
jgi:hypothetical protein